MIRAAETDRTESGLIDFSDMPDLGLSEIQRFLDRQQGMEGFSFTGLMEDLLKGNLESAGARCLSAFRTGVMEEWSDSVGFLAQAAALGVLGAVFAQASSVFPSSRISESVFFITYLLAFACLTASFFSSVAAAASVVERVLEFMKVVLPAFFLAVASAGGSLSGGALYGSVIGAAGIAEGLCGRVLLPLIKVYVLLVLAGNLSREAVISRMTKGLESGIRWSLKTMTGLFFGLQMIQTMILPYADSVKRAGIHKLVSAIPGIGSGADALIQVTVGAGVLVKNTIGGAAVVVMVILMAAPAAKLLLFSVLYRAAAALMEPVCDKRIAACAEGIGKAHQLLLEVVTGVILLFALSIGLICTATNAVYFGG